MEAVASAAGGSTQPVFGNECPDGLLSRRSSSSATSSSSFRLRSPSLNTLRLLRIFDLFDKNGDGILTVDELHQALGLLGLDADFSDIDSTITSFIKPGNIGLQYEDFVSLHQSLDDAFFGGVQAAMEEDVVVDMTEQEESDLSEAFKVFDVDGDGFISAHELQVVLEKLGLPEGKEISRVQQMILSVDRNHDGMVDFIEFKDMMRRSVLFPSTA